MLPSALLTEREVAALVALYDAARGSLSAHVPSEAILSRFRKDFRGYVAEGLDDLAKHPERYVIKHPTRGAMTYQISITGVRKLQELRLI
jgi:hypothetical protein